MLRRAEKLTDIAEQVVTHLPKSKAMRDAVDARRPRPGARRLRRALLGPLRDVHRDRGRLHGRRVVSLCGSLTPQDQARFPFDAGVLDWKYYLQDVHCPAVTQSLRELSRRDRETPVVRIRERDDTVLAVFDMEGTIISSNVVESYVWTRFADLPPEEWPARARERVRADPRLPADRPARPGGFPSHVLPPVRGCECRGRRAP